MHNAAANDQFPWTRHFNFKIQIRNVGFRSNYSSGEYTIELIAKLPH